MTEVPTSFLKHIFLSFILKPFDNYADPWPSFNDVLDQIPTYWMMSSDLIHLSRLWALRTAQSLEEVLKRYVVDRQMDAWMDSWKDRWKSG
jgi:hypothetical protein